MRFDPSLPGRDGAPNAPILVVAVDHPAQLLLTGGSLAS
jgi:hypothetical protein